MKTEEPNFSGLKALNNMTFSAMRQHIMIFLVVSQSNAFLSGSDRLDLIQDLINQPIKHTPESVSDACHKLADSNLTGNLINSQILRDTGRGY